MSPFLQKIFLTIVVSHPHVTCSPVPPVRDLWCCNQLKNGLGIWTSYLPEIAEIRSWLPSKTSSVTRLERVPARYDPPQPPTQSMAAFWGRTLPLNVYFNVGFKFCRVSPLMWSSPTATINFEEDQHVRTHEGTAVERCVARARLVSFRLARPCWTGVGKADAGVSCGVSTNAHPSEQTGLYLVPPGVKGFHSRGVTMKSLVIIVPLGVR